MKVIADFETSLKPMPLLKGVFSGDLPEMNLFFIVRHSSKKF